jgi:16S rRNA (uracil1498-N3)-methyltransferase
MFVHEPLEAGRDLPLAADQAHYLTHVMRLKPGASLLVFNGRDGEWRASLSGVSKRGASLVVDAPTRPQTSPPA